MCSNSTSVECPALSTACMTVTAAPSSLMNGKLCPACASSDDSLAGTCNATLSCVGVEDSCFSGN
ncbi:uncharacterized protein AKAME5_001307500, partial [Lates japonicus]